MQTLQKISTKNGDIADALARTYYGQEASVVDLYNDNPHLIKHGAVLRGGLDIVVPRQTIENTAPSVVKIRLW
jgi:phage tail protein X